MKNSRLHCSGYSDTRVVTREQIMEERWRGSHARQSFCEREIREGEEAVIPRSKIVEMKPPYVCLKCFIHTYNNNMTNRFHVQ
jgi:hypothetical protein